MSNRVSHSLVSALRHVPEFADLEEHALLELVGCSANLHWGDEQVVFDRDDPAEALYIVLSGQVLIMDPAQGNEVATIERGEYFGELALLLESTHSKRAIALGETELMVVPRDSFGQLLQERPELERQFRRRLEERLGLTSTSV